MNGKIDQDTRSPRAANLDNRGELTQEEIAAAAGKALP
jgi:hypothetical protein